jgi:pimeloyl-ACP methyl ester carboxylesterase
MLQTLRECVAILSIAARMG